MGSSFLFAHDWIVEQKYIWTASIYSLTSNRLNWIV